MNSTTIRLAGALGYGVLAILLTGGTVWGQSGLDTPGAAKFLEDRCGACHGNVPNPVVPGFNDLKIDSLVKAKYLVPGEPADSAIWRKIELGEMPPAHLKQSLSVAEKETFRAWLAAYQPDTLQRMTLTETLRQDPRLRKVMQVAETAGVLDLLDNPGPFTVLAPINEAFAAPNVSEELLKNPGMAYDVLLNHGLLGEVRQQDIKRLGEIQTGFGNKLHVRSDPLRIGNEAAQIIEADILCENGVIHIIDRLVVDPLQGSIFDSEKTKFSVTEFGVRMVELDGGEFLMGTDPAANENDRPDDESPQRKVRVSPFLIGQHEITWSQYMNVMQENPAVGWVRELPSGGMPVYDVSWTQAAIFCNRCSHKENLTPYYRILDDGQNVMVETRDIRANGYRLPTEAEWEFAARAEAVGDWFCPKAQLDQFAWVRPEGGRLEGPQLTGTKKPNPWDLYDVLGNVGEWCDDWYADYVQPEGIDVLVNPRVLAPTNVEKKVYRGGSYVRDADNCRLSWRGNAVPGFRHKGIGFRIARSPRRSQ
jgi:formylglycine-generating enzyme required for sulfatase activity